VFSDVLITVNTVVTYKTLLSCGYSVPTFSRCCCPLCCRLKLVWFRKMP